MSDFTHLDSHGRVRMVDVTDKTATVREATARGLIRMTPRIIDQIQSGSIAKGNVLETARIAGVMAAKKTADIIPMCHPLAITHAAVDFELQPDKQAVEITATVRLTGKTGVEMEALTAVATAALTLYDMCKALDKGMVITDICLLEKTGGKSGIYKMEKKADE
ncbi:MAG: cyclic pyranopterin monophosphate synthase MoaC [Desulfobacterales bacterium]|nr:cyclic pyranopterin monophosphate synthase MoaC [Desulfobacterales bacterium]